MAASTDCPVEQAAGHKATLTAAAVAGRVNVNEVGLVVASKADVDMLVAVPAVARMIDSVGPVVNSVVAQSHQCRLLVIMVAAQGPLDQLQAVAIHMKVMSVATNVQIRG